MQEKKSFIFHKWTVLFLFLFSSLLLIPFLGSYQLFDWDEINFAECAREMIVTNNYLQVQIDFEPFWEKPPLFIWFQVISMKLFGINEFSARLPNAIIGIFTVIVLYLIGKRLFDYKFGLIWSLVYIGSFLPHFYFKSGIIDPLFNFLMFLSIYYVFYYLTINPGEKKYLIIAGIFSGLAVLTKGPVGFLLPFLSFFIYFIYKRKFVKSTPVDLLIFIISAMLASLTWFGLEYYYNGTWFLENFTKYQIRLLTTGDAGHSGPIYYHLVVLLIGCFPASAFVFNAFSKKLNLTNEQNELKLILTILLIVVIVIFSIVKTKIVHYSSLSYYPITFLAAVTIWGITEKKLEIKKNNYILLIPIGLFYGLIFTSIPILMFYKDLFLHKITNKFVYGNLNMNVNWTGWESLIGLLFLSIFIFSIILLFKKSFLKGIILIFSSIIITIFLMAPTIVSKIEKHVQGAAIEFYQNLQNKPVYVTTLGFKSYAQLFYSRKTPIQSASYLKIPNNEYNNYLLNGKITRPAYFVLKIQDEEEWISKGKITKLYDKGGFSFFERLPDF